MRSSDGYAKNKQCEEIDHISRRNNFTSWRILTKTHPHRVIQHALWDTVYFTYVDEVSEKYL